MTTGLATRSERLLACAAVCFATGWVVALARLRRLRRKRRNCDAPLVFSTTFTHVVRSAEGHAYRVNVSLPLSYHRVEGGRYPVIFALDGEAYLFPLLATVARTNHYFKWRRGGGYPDFIVVGVTADLEDEFTSVDAASGEVDVDVASLWTALRPSRARDYLPTAAESPWGAPGAGSLLHVSGHASTFARFVESTLVPFVDKAYRTKISERAIVGKSFAGSGVAHLMLDEGCAPLFSHFLVCSPSLRWDDWSFFRLEEESHRSRQPLAAGVLACVGEKENVESVQRLEEVLSGRGYPNLDLSVKIFPGEDHGSASYPFAHYALEWLAERLARTSSEDAR